MNIVNIHQAKTQLSQLLSRVEKGEKIIIANRGKPVAFLTPYTDESLFHQRIPGRLKGQFTVSENFYESDEEIISLFEGK
ncbi:type II toxin-antitoxin system prevent-host-death family antitoxin [Cyanobacterium aponinum AL20118]|uniref:Antitoxin n=2 Tax=Cyanobacterium aponinum TaxID=379064 RepID=K9Z7V3_CYAAP|nr:type II toxin-antitoxin system prevent-host-death family antitoxin [Cyanobacterium aponinum]AFZ55209.1 prevent-host-death family protein [Cyanobacterium aponinum PCC 10605]MBD2394798.1 type II toxin-antitoxin system Phd/YefM family antitoxin [Cyanobacterium aponinum FACHB-4101]PHV63354.1 type II toxin-antitoxin system prevent-host-death family antitoxin [Cyanobacterium aponinum IPPAS B-1201]WPF88379.1 type II toxin-antitoxin system prevent-host-death family antitoxin [Cyanobacterium aponinum